MNTQFENELYLKLKEAEHQALNTAVRYNSKEVIEHLRKQLLDKVK